MQDSITKCLGLVTQYNSLTTAEGALSQADDCIVRRENIVESRRGYNAYSASALSNTPTQMLTYMSRVLSHNGTELSYDNGSGTFAAYTGSYTAPSGYLMDSAESNSNLYFTTSVGVKALVNVTGTAAKRVGVARPIEIGVQSWNAGAAVLSYGDLGYAAYRAVIIRTDTNSNVIYSAASARQLVINAAAWFPVGPGASASPVIRVYLPAEIAAEITAVTAAATDYQVQLYRTVIGTPYAAATGDTAGDEMFLVYQVTVATADVTNGYVEITDIVPTSIGAAGTALYVNAAQEGATQSNSKPPLAKSIALYKSSFLMLANCTLKHRLKVTLLSAAALTANDTVTINGVTYTAKAAENIGSNEFQIWATASVSTNVQETAKSLCRVINRSASNTAIYAFYQGSSTGSDVGTIVFEEREPGGAGFGFNTSSGGTDAFYPKPATSAPTSGDLFSKADSQPNYLYYSKAQQFEAFPELNYIQVGPKNKAILRIKALRDSLIIMTEGGVYRLTGDSPSSFSVQPLDLNVIVRARNSVANVNNVIFALSNQGVVAISDTGVETISRKIEPSINPLLTFSSIDTYTYGIGYESERQYVISTMSLSTDTAPTQTYVYNLFTGAWTRWTFGITSGVVESSVDKLFFTKPSVNYVYRERKSFSDDDYSDPNYDLTITAISGSVVTVSGTLPEAGWVISQTAGSLTTQIVISSVATVGALYQLTLETAPPSTWVAGTATIYPSIPFVIQWKDWVGEQPGALKCVSQVQILADSQSDNNTTTQITAGFSNDSDTEEDDVAISSDASGWGDEWGGPWGGIGDSYSYRTYVTQRKVYSRFLRLRAKHRRALERCSVAGVSITFSMVSDRPNR